MEYGPKFKTHFLPVVIAITSLICASASRPVNRANSECCTDLCKD